MREVRLLCIHKFTIIIIILFIFCPELNSCYSDRIYQEIAIKSLSLMPKALRNVLKLHMDELLAGAAESASLKNSEDHFLFNDNSYGKANLRIKQISDKIVYDVYHHVSFNVIAREFGYVAHYITDLNNPLHISKGDNISKQCEIEFNKFMVNNLEKFPFVFYGYSSKHLENNDIQAFTNSIMQRSIILRDRLMEKMYIDGKVVSAIRFDEKSAVFGVAAISYQHSISNTVQLWFHIWKNAHGDTLL